jgi:hypothetical protein
MTRSCAPGAFSLLVLLFGPALVRGADAQAPRPTPVQIEKLQKELDQLKKEVAELKNELAPAEPQKSEAAAIEDIHRKIDEINRKIDAITRELEAMQMGEAVSPAGKAPMHYGVGPAAAKIYSTRSGVSIGGYGEVLYQNFAAKRQDGAPSKETDELDLQRAVVYFGYRFNDQFVFNSEVEYEHAVTSSDKNGETEVEFAYVDYMAKPALNARAGLILIPVGLTNQAHEPTVFLGARRPDVEQRIIPTTWRELGAGFYGDTGVVAYQLYLVNGLDASRYDAEGIGEGSSEGSQARTKDFAVTGRVDYIGVPGLAVGASFFNGASGQGERTPDGRSFSGRTTLWDAHAIYRSYGLDLRGLYARTTVGDAARINALDNLDGNESVGSRQEGWYLQAGYDLLSLVPRTKMSLIPFVRYEEFDTQAAVPAGYERDPANDVQEWTAGVVYKPIDRIAVKADWQRIHNAARTGVNQWNLLIGYLF